MFVIGELIFYYLPNVDISFNSPCGQNEYFAVDPAANYLRVPFAMWCVLSLKCERC